MHFILAILLTFFLAKGKQDTFTDIFAFSGGNPEAAEGFVKLWGLPLQVNHQVNGKLDKES